MKGFSFKLCLAIALMAMSALNAQAKPATPPPGPDSDTPCITMTVINAGVPVQLIMQAANDNDSVWIVNGTDTTKVDVGTTTIDTLVTAQTDTIKLYGNLASFTCSNPNLKGLSFSEGLTNLKDLYCYDNSLDSLDVSKLTNLERLDCVHNRLTELNVRGLTNLKYLRCSDNSLTKLDVAGLTNLIFLGCAINSLDSLDVSKLTNLEDLDCGRNRLTELDVRGLTNLIFLACDNNKIIYLDLIGTGVRLVNGVGNSPAKRDYEKVTVGTDLLLQQPGYDIYIRLNSNNIADKDFIDVAATAEHGSLTTTTTMLPTPVINRTVQIVSKGLETSPKATAGFHYVAGHKDFTFTVYSKDSITVTTSRGDVVGEGILLTQNKEAGTWIVTVRKISTNMVINVSEAKTENGEITANATIAGEDAVWSSNGMVHIRTSVAGVAYIYNVRGSLCKQVPITGDASFAMPEGFYVVRLNGKSYKVKN